MNISEYYQEVDDVKLSEAYPKWYTELSNQYSDGGIFKDLYLWDKSNHSSAVWFPWVFADLKGTDLTTANLWLDKEYHGQRRFKTVSPLLDYYISTNATGDAHNILTAIERQQIVKTIAYKFKDKWQHLWEVSQKDYDPIWNVDYEEVRTPDLRFENGVDEDADGNSYKVTSTTGTATDMTTTASVDTGNDVWGFNSNSGVDATANESDSTQNVKGTAANNTSTNEQTQQGITWREDTGTETITKKGNYGVTSTQDLMTQEKQFWIDFNFWNIIFKDVDSVLTTPKYTI